MRNLEEFIHADDGIDPLVKLPLVHYQFEAVHPFADGNGRTGRIINILFLVQKGLLDLPVLYLSKDIIERKNDYYRLLRNVTKSGAWEPWILYLLDAVENMATLTQKKILAIRALMLETMEQAKRELPKRVYSKDLIEVLFRQPYCKIAFLVQENIASRNIASNYLNELVKIGILKKVQLGKEFVYLNVKLYDLLSS